MPRCNPCSNKQTMPRQVEVLIPPLSQTFDYLVPSDLAEILKPGWRVEVPLGSRVTNAYLIASRESDPAESRPYKLKTISQNKANHPAFRTDDMPFYKWAADYYAEPLSNVIDAAVPAPAPRKFSRNIVLLSEEVASKRSKSQAALLEALKEAGGSCDYALLSRRFKQAAPALKALEAAGNIRIDYSEQLSEGFFSEDAPAWAPAELELNEAQKCALKSIKDSLQAGEFKAFLLHGVTGSGKTEVYIDAIKAARELGRGALVIVPEIALTPQLVDRFRARLGGEISVLHSALNKRLRWDSWRALLEGRHHIAIGTRSAIFAPVPNLGLIIVDEEHDSSFKQSDGFRYNARDLSIVRAEMLHAPVVLGSATPSLESVNNTKRGRFVRLSLPARPSMSSDISVELVDLSRLKHVEMVTKNISPKLYQALGETMDRGEQAFVMYNRRGFASFLQCDKCETALECPNCSVTMTYHQYNNALLCHYCNLSIVPPEFCPKCTAPGEAGAQGGKKSSVPPKLVLRGGGTEKVFDELTSLFPKVSIDRLDRDSAFEHDDYLAILQKVRDGETRILVGTQMIAKGHDLPNVTLVGIIDCDVGLHMPDFRSAERVFQLLTQASGRAGRGQRPGSVILQTRVPEHPSLIHTLNKNYEAFALQELKVRKALGYPPFSRMLRLVASSQQAGEPDLALFNLKMDAEKLIKEREFTIAVLGPAPAPIQKLKTQFRSHLLFKAQRASQLSVLLRHLKEQKSKSKTLRVAFDLDPQDML